MPLDLGEILAFEEEWDEVLGGPQTRGHREIGAYVISRLVSCGAELHEVLKYFDDCMTRFGAVRRPPPEPPQ